MSYLYYDFLKNCTHWEINLPLEVAEFMGIKLRDAIEKKMSKERVGEIYDEMEKNVGLLFLKNKIFSELYLNNYDVSDDFRQLFIKSLYETFNISCDFFIAVLKILCFCHIKKVKIALEFIYGKL